MASIAKRPDGHYRARYRDEAGAEHSRHFDRKVDAKQWLDQVTAAVVTGQYVDPKAGRITFADFYTQWSSRQVWVAGTRRSMGITARSVTFSNVPLRSLRRSHVESWVKSMSSRGLAASTIATRANNVRAVLRGAVADRVIPVDPSAGVTLPRRRRREAAMALPSAADVKRLLDAADVGLRAFVGLGAFAGLRPGESAGVQVGDIDFLRGTLSVTRQVQRIPGGFEIRAPKYGSERQVFLAPSLVAMLSEHLASSVPAGEKPEPTRWLFTGEGDEPPLPNTVDHRWRMLRKRAGVVGAIKLHDMRHFYASGLIAAGCDVVTVQRALGHASATTTLDTYSHLWPTAEDRTRNAAEGLLELTASAGPTDCVRTSAQH
jgi:integrase